MLMFSPTPALEKAAGVVSCFRVTDSVSWHDKVDRSISLPRYAASQLYAVTKLSHCRAIENEMSATVARLWTIASVGPSSRSRRPATVKQVG